MYIFTVYTNSVLKTKQNTVFNTGRRQLLSGLRRLDLKYEGDPALRPIGDLEVTFLVRLLYRFTSAFNTKVILFISYLQRMKWKGA